MMMPVATGEIIQIKGKGEDPEEKKSNLKIFLNSQELADILQMARTGQVVENPGARATIQYHTQQTIEAIKALIGREGSPVQLLG